MFKTLSKELRFNGQVFLHTGNMLYFNRDRLLKPGQFTDTEISHFKTSLLICFEEDTGHNSIHFLAYMKLLSMALNISIERGFRTDELLPTILKKIGPYRGNQRLVEMCFANALKLYISEQESSRKKIFKMECFLNIETSMRLAQRFPKNYALEFLLQIYRFHLNGHNREPYSTEELEVLMADIEIMMNQYHQNSENSGIFFYVANRSSNLVAQDFAAWVFQKVYRQRCI
ncbi:hypothetical protein CAEBREN_25661 [Caenorhabditis brenneri]|uniref:Uncharacterized protein n=1 Tax=Caenorhabditis brenneri TaxID=135651 RepID=G0MF41_CAEBE|nr:hypothetical protein CAEBREN_25661 [Caenorhabditis brenneri]